EKLTAAFGYRLAEFFTPPDDPDKLNLYDQFIDRFYQAVQFDQKDCHFIPFQGGVLPALRFTLEVSKGTIVFIGGHDSFMEELY
ncbi:MAG: alpha/beta hydrolase, partial [candidate division Zixibacteria bacterium]|nr:alpha/beta hydrolase [candidate division Zixibacteria bacterium]NIU17247.1 alpha/beta hydrolase [candidate division Zixibacteria bacterium]NIV07686.1 alpha/beta hydrolase [candidate division Zixibacteria bacterium]NIW48184.1 alpha/beta hydrolase [Gammaproteobacteria bacterium]